MQTMKNFILLLLMIYVASSCRSVERQLICNEVEKYQIAPTESCITSIKFESCLCAPFDVNTWSITGDYEKKPLEYCDGIEGVKVEFGVQEIQPKFIALQRLREESCRKRKQDR